MTKTVDVDVYGDKGGKISINKMRDYIVMNIGRTVSQDPSQVAIPDRMRHKVDVVRQLELLKQKNKRPMIQHQINITSTYASLNIELKMNYLEDTRLVILGSYEKMATLRSCDFLQIVQKLPMNDGKFKKSLNLHDGYVNVVTDNVLEWFISSDLIANKTGVWYFAVISLIEAPDKPIDELIDDRRTCQYSRLEDSMLDDEFAVETYEFVAYTGGGYALNPDTEIWEGIGMVVLNNTRTSTAFKTNHLTSFATGFAPQVNKIDFALFFAKTSFTDNMTITVTLG